MFKKIVRDLSILILSVLLIGCSSLTPDGDQEKKLPQEGQVPHQEEQRDEPEVDPIEEQIKKLSLNEKIGQMLILGIEGDTLDAEAKGLYEDIHPGGYILFRRNVKDA